MGCPDADSLILRVWSIIIMQVAQPTTTDGWLIFLLCDTAGLVIPTATGLEISWTLEDRKLQSQHTFHSSGIEVNI